MSALVSSSQSATGALQAAQAGNQILALQAQQLADLTAAVAAAGTGPEPSGRAASRRPGSGEGAASALSDAGRRLSAHSHHDVPLMTPSITLATAARVGAMAFVVARDRRDRGSFQTGRSEAGERFRRFARRRRRRSPAGRAEAMPAPWRGRRSRRCLPARLGREPPPLPWAGRSVPRNPRQSRCSASARTSRRTPNGAPAAHQPTPKGE